MPTKWYVYRLINKTRTYKYIGITQNLDRRLLLHNRGLTKSTKPYRPFDKIDVVEICNSRQAARNREKYYKSGAGRELLKSHYLGE